MSMKPLQFRAKLDGSTKPHAMASNESSSSVGSSSPPEFDFNLPCRYFKSTFARSLSLNNANVSGVGTTCKSLDFVPITTTSEPPQGLPHVLPRTTHGNLEFKLTSGHNNNNNVENQPARRSQQQQQQQHILVTQFTNTANPRSPSIPTTTTKSIPKTTIHHASHSDAKANNNQQATVVGSGFIRRNIWSLKNSEQDFNFQCRMTDNPSQNNAPDEREDSLQPPQLPVLQPEGVNRLHPFEMAAMSGHPQESGSINVEAVLLQNQVDTLKWQLKQVETSREMYRSVMEEVARFLDRYHSQQLQKRVHQQKQLQQQLASEELETKSSRSSVGHMEQIARSKSLHHVNGGSVSGVGLDAPKRLPDDDGQLSSGYLRTRSSTNLIDLKQRGTAPVNAHSSRDGHPAKAYIGDNNFYSAFNDFTWRRSPKKQKECGRSHISVDESEEKFDQEAYRLSRTIHNLLNTSSQQPDLTHHRNSAVTPGGCNASQAVRGLCGKTPIPRCESVASSSPSLSGSIAVLEHAPPALAEATKNDQLENTPNKCSARSSDMLFLRSANMRESRLSLRSCTDSSVHSTISSAASSSSSSSSSKVETDEEVPSVANPFRPSSMLINVPGNKGTQNHLFGSGTEDESGFSSINSFHDVGVPLSSTLISNAAIRGRNLGPNSSSDQHSYELDSEETRDSRCNATLKPDVGVPFARHPNNIVGVPLQTNHDMHHRWDAPSSHAFVAAKTYRNANKFQQRFSTISNEDSATVLWV